MTRVQIKFECDQLLEMAAAYGARVAWRRFGSHLQFLRQRSETGPLRLLHPKSAGVGDDYQSGAKLHALHTAYST